MNINSKRDKSKRRRIRSIKFYCCFCKAQKKKKVVGMEQNEFLLHLIIMHEEDYVETTWANMRNKHIIRLIDIIRKLGILKI